MIDNHNSSNQPTSGVGTLLRGLQHLMTKSNQTLVGSQDLPGQPINPLKEQQQQQQQQQTRTNTAGSEGDKLSSLPSLKVVPAIEDATQRASFRKSVSSGNLMHGNIGKLPSTASKGPKSNNLATPTNAAKGRSSSEHPDSHSHHAKSPRSHTETPSTLPAPTNLSKARISRSQNGLSAANAQSSASHPLDEDTDTVSELSLASSALTINAPSSSNAPHVLTPSASLPSSSNQISSNSNAIPDPAPITSVNKPYKSLPKISSVFHRTKTAK
ncbi:hypothetical protein HK101_005831, partial [Irineochytrium annulatum]